METDIIKFEWQLKLASKTFILKVKKYFLVLLALTDFSLIISSNSSYKL